MVIEVLAQVRDKINISPKTNSSGDYRSAALLSVSKEEREGGRRV